MKARRRLSTRRKGCRLAGGGAAPHGFALAAVLWLLAGLAVLVTSVSTSMLAVARTNRDLAARVKLEVAQQRALAAVAYLVLTNKLLGTGAQVGSGMLPLDGRTLRIDDDAVAELQDTEGLIGLNSSSGDNLRGLLLQCGASARSVDGLVDSLLDYIDEDSLKRLNGAETFDYRGRGLPPPRNQPLASRAELWRVLGWDAIRPAWMAQHCDDWTTLSAAAGVNLWTAQLPVLLAIGLGSDEAKQALAERDALRNMQRLSAMLLAVRERQGGNFQAMSRFAVRSRGEVRVTVRMEGVHLARRFVVSRGGPDNAWPYLLSDLQWLPAESLPWRHAGAASASVSDLEALDAYMAIAATRGPNNDAQVLPFSPQRP